METAFFILWQIVISPLLLIMNVYNIIIYMSFFTVEGIIRFFGSDPESSNFIFMNTIIITSALVFFLTFLIYKIFIKIKNIETFKYFFEISYLISVYFSGLISLINLFKPNMINDEKINVVGLFANDPKLSTAMAFFIAVTNYTLFKNLILKGK